MKLPMTKFGDGDGVPLVLVHGLFGQGKNLAGIARAMSKARSVYTVDLRNHGNAPWDDQHDYSAMADDLYESFADFGKIDMMGHSMGGKAAMVLALEHPELINRLIIADIAPVSYSHDHSHLIDAMLDIDFNELKSRREVDAALAQKIDDDGTRSFLIHGLATKDKPAWKNNLTVLKNNMAEIIAWPKVEGQFTGSTLFIGGENSDYLKDEYRLIIDRYFPNTRITRIKNAGHWLHAEKPEIFIEIMQYFFKH